MLRRLRGVDFVAQLLWVERVDGACRLVFPIARFTLDQVIQKALIFEDAHKLHLTRQLFAGMKNLHARNVIHRDVKPANILCGVDCSLIICDFGLSCMLNEEDDEVRTRTYVISLWYRPPELLTRRWSVAYGLEVDMWSAGCVVAEIYARRALFKARTIREQRIAIYRALQSQNKNDVERASHRRRFFGQIAPCAAVCDALDACLREDPTSRASAHSLVERVCGA